LQPQTQLLFNRPRRGKLGWCPHYRRRKKTRKALARWKFCTMEIWDADAHDVLARMKGSYAALVQPFA
jgi:hypothetical protein